MISICIPVYNFDVTRLVESLSAQIKSNPTMAEIILIDDASSEEFKQINETVCSGHTYIKLPENVGRAAIRNLFLKYAQFEYLLFLDCDSIIVQDDFVTSYLLAIKSLNPQVVCGGRVYDLRKPDRNHTLRWKVGVNRESLSSEVRNNYPNRSFMTNNFLIRRELLQSVRFEERLKEYGHEDTLFGFELKKRKILTLHINNPVLNGDVEDNALFLSKTERGVANLVDILQFVNYNSYFVEEVRILDFHRKTKQYHLTRVLQMLYLIFRIPIKALLLRGYVFLPLFDFYKLGLLIDTEFSKQREDAKFRV